MKSGDTKSKSSGKMARSGGADQVKAVQQALKDKGVDPGEVDGKMGPKTQSALREYQKKEGLKESGRLDTETMAKLGVAKTSDTGSSTTPSASPSTGASTGSSSGAGSSSSSGGSSSGAAAKPSDSSSSGAGAATGSGSSSTPSKQSR
jgi:peptidoglycan hydrolase-like protein with peptidoglycan-binding domain